MLTRTSFAFKTSHNQPSIIIVVKFGTRHSNWSFLLATTLPVLCSSAVERRPYCDERWDETFCGLLDFADHINDSLGNSGSEAEGSDARADHEIEDCASGRKGCRGLPVAKERSRLDGCHFTPRSGEDDFSNSVLSRHIAYCPGPRG